ncbi:acyl-CoA thioesterase [Parapedobacter pyrenivorans]|uniref:Acyl-CoA thioesterase n=2 Tax=Parapedobacter pyrenivorans TaxID=1305674 RepID=A0A917HRD5_9SPHI|nr:acyl-CoA thioesterase [Parapedobacter pyrenivorans]
MRSINAQAQHEFELPAPFHMRGGLPNFFDKVKNRIGSELCVAYIGGSITEARDGWRELTYHTLRTSFPHNTFKHVDAAIGGTTSTLGVFRMDQDVLRHKPDLLFVEFAVNDSPLPPDVIYRSIEGIVRKTWSANPNTDICFVYTITETIVDKFRETGRFPRAAEAMEQVAQHYGIPSIHIGVEVAKLREAGDLVFTGNPGEHPGKIVFTADKVHPLPASGHPICAHIVMKHLMEMQGRNASHRHELKKPFVSDNWESAKMLSLSEFDENKDWVKLEQDHPVQKQVASFIPALYKAVPPDATIRIRFEGNVLGFYDVIGPGSGILDVNVNGKASEVTRFDNHCIHYRKTFFFLDGLNDGVNDVTIKVSGKEFDKAAILLQNPRKLTMDDPARFADNAWFLGNILMVGKPIAINFGD